MIEARYVADKTRIFMSSAAMPALRNIIGPQHMPKYVACNIIGRTRGAILSTRPSAVRSLGSGPGAGWNALRRCIAAEPNGRGTGTAPCRSGDKARPSRRRKDAWRAAPRRVGKSVVVRRTEQIQLDGLRAGWVHGRLLDLGRWSASLHRQPPWTTIPPALPAPSNRHAAVPARGRPNKPAGRASTTALRAGTRYRPGDSGPRERRP